MSRSRSDQETLEAITDVLRDAGVPKDILDRARPELAGLERCTRCGHRRREHEGQCLWISTGDVDDDDPRYRTCDCKQFTSEPLKNGKRRMTARLRQS